MKLPFFSFWFQRINLKYFLVIDIGTETVKTLILERSGSRNIILGASTQYFDRFGVFNTQNLERDIVEKTIKKAIEESYLIFLRNLAHSFKKRNREIRPKFVYLGLPANIFRGRIISQSLKRKTPQKKIDKIEEKNIYQDILDNAQRRISQDFGKEMGILPQDFQFLTLKILEMKIDGYEVPQLTGFKGEKLDFQVLTTFLPKDYLAEIKKIIQNLDLSILKITHLAENLLYFLDKKTNGIFLDVGGEVTQIFLIVQGKLKLITDFKGGGKIFSEVLSDRLGLEEEKARILKENYSKGILSEEVRRNIRDLFLLSVQNWFSSFKFNFKKISITFLPLTILLCGGGSQLPEIEEILIEENKERLGVANQSEVKYFYPKDLKNTEDRTKSLTTPQDITPLLLIPPS